MVVNAILRTVLAISTRLGILTLLASGARSQSIPTKPGVGFPIVSIAAGQTARINALNSGPLTQAASGCRVGLQFYDTQGQLLKQTAIAGLVVGKVAELDLSRTELPGKDPASILAVVVFGYSGGANPPRGIVEATNCRIVPSLEISDDQSGRTSIVLTTVWPLPGPATPAQ